MTYRELANQILQLSEKQQDMKVVRFDGNYGVFYRLGSLSIVEDEDMPLEIDHPYLEG